MPPRLRANTTAAGVHACRRLPIHISRAERAYKSALFRRRRADAHTSRPEKLAPFLPPSDEYSPLASAARRASHARPLPLLGLARAA